MKTIALKLALSTLLLSAAAALAQSDTMWDKSYPVTGQPSLFLSTGDSHLNIHACELSGGSCSCHRRKYEPFAIHP